MFDVVTNKQEIGDNTNRLAQKKSDRTACLTARAAAAAAAAATGSATLNGGDLALDGVDWSVDGCCLSVDAGQLRCYCRCIRSRSGAQIGQTGLDILELDKLLPLFQLCDTIRA